MREAENTGTIDTVLIADGLKRVLQTKKDATVHGDDNLMIVSGRVTFDGLGRTVRTNGVDQWGQSKLISYWYL